MNVFKCISNDVSALSPESTINEAKQLFKYLTFTHLPIVNNTLYLGSIAEKDVVYQENGTEKMSDYTQLYASFFADEDMNWLELLKLFTINETNILPILNSEKQYIGYYELNNILHLFYETPFLNESGTFLIIEKDLKGYSFSEISQIIESNNCNLLGLFISDIKDNKVQITLKMDSCNITSVTQTFRRYGYQLISDFQDDIFIESLKERSDYLQKYLNI